MFDLNQSLFEDRDEYSLSLESQIEDFKSKNLDISALSQQIADLASRIERIEFLSSPSLKDGDYCHSNKLHPVSDAFGRMCGFELDIIKKRLKTLEEAADQKKPLIRFSNPTVDQVMDRVDEVEINCARLTEDALATVQGLHEELGVLRSSMEESSKKELNEIEARLHEMLSDAVEKISAVLRKVVAVQKSLGQNNGVAISPSRARSLSKNDRRKLIDDLHREINFLERM